MVRFLLDMPLVKLKTHLSLDIPPRNSGLQNLGKFVSMSITLAAMSAWGSHIQIFNLYKKEMNRSILSIVLLK